MGSRIGLKQTNKQSFYRNVPNQWLITEQFKIIDLLPDFDKISENGRNIYEWNQINQTILEIDFDRTFSNGQPQKPPGRLTFRRFRISKYHQYSILRNTFQCHWIRPIETTSWPLRIDGC